MTMIRILIPLCALFLVSCQPDCSQINCDNFDNSELNIINAEFIYTSDKDIETLEILSKNLLRPKKCGDNIILRKPHLRFLGSKNTSPLWDCVPLTTDGDIKEIKFISRANQIVLKCIDWVSYKNKKPISTDSIHAGVLSYGRNIKDLLIYSEYPIDTLYELNIISDAKTLTTKFDSLICAGKKVIDVLLLNSENLKFSQKDNNNKYQVEFTDSELTDRFRLPDQKKRNEELKKYRSKLIQKLQQEPTDWNILYLLARAEMLISPNNSKALDIAADYLIKASHEAFVTGNGQNLLSLINKHEHEAFKTLLNKEDERRWKIESCKTGLKKSKKEYLRTSINYMTNDSKGKRIVNIDPDQKYNHIGKYNKRFSIGIVTYDPKTTNCTLNFTYPDEPSNFNTRISLSKFGEEEIEVNDELIVILGNQSIVNNDFVTLSYKEKKKTSSEDGELDVSLGATSTGSSTDNNNSTGGLTAVVPRDNGITKGGEINNNDSDDDGFKDSDDDCPKRFSKINNGCPELNVKNPSSIYKNLPQTFEVAYEQNRSNDRVFWESSNSVNIVGAQNLKPSIEFPNVGKYPISVSVNNYSDDFSLSKSIDVYVKVGVAELEELFNHIIRYGNDGKTVKGTPEQREYFINNIAPKADRALEKIYKMCDSKAIPIMKSKSTSKLEVMVRRFKEAKEINTTINDFEITNIEYSKETGLINKIVYNFKS